MSSARRPLLTATAAATLLGALWFVPSANATQDSPARTQPSPTATTQARATSATSPSDTGTTADDTVLADTGAFDTTPYVIGGTAFLTLGAGFVVYSVRRERLGF
ncbi:hypothetical protein ABZT17_35710 [Streptomyces sp. NPDC005648]|uniref:hypothetical protein n=1 Tax=Streptomyces sp. NPDC005648 TaxID=3157044 RepID=UPI0033BA87B2